MRRLPLVVALTAALLLALAGIAHATVEVTIGDDGLDPESVEADLGEDIIWTNASDQDVTLVGFGQDLESGPIQPGATFGIKIVEKGTFLYESEDGSLKGEIVVAGGEQTGGQEDGEDPVEETDESDTEDDGETRGDNGGQGEDRDPLPETGIDVTLPAALSVVLILLGASLVLLTRPQRARP